MKIPRPEHPEPQLKRENWLNLNGEWEFEIDWCNQGKYDIENNDSPERVIDGCFASRRKLNDKIIVPFAPESELSGIGEKRFMDAVWYRRDITLPQSFEGKRVILHFGAVDHEATVYINGTKVGTHKGGYTPFQFDITDYLNGKDDYITVLAEDDMRNGRYGAGKQASRANSHGCFYTRTTGIWQTVWLEAVSPQHIDFFRLTPVVEDSALMVTLNTAKTSATTLTATAYFDGKTVGEKSIEIKNGYTAFSLALSELHLWDLGQGNLYDLKFTLCENGEVVDEVSSYFGMRSVCLRDGKFYLNGKSVFGRFILDQGFYKDGIYTAPTVECFDRDVRLAMDLGYNGARFHEKVFEPLAIYAADKAGYMIWDEYPDWNMKQSNTECLPEFLRSWQEEIKRDYSRPSIIGWCCMNETWDWRNERQDDDVLRTVYYMVKSLDNTRPVIDTSGNYHVITDTFDVHNYEQDVDTFRKMYADDPHYDKFPNRQKYDGTPFWVSEYGGIRLIEGDVDGWGYGKIATSKEEFIERYCGLTKVLQDNPECWALCYTQLYDVEQEINGLYHYDRSNRFTEEEKEIMRKAMTAKAAVED